MKIELIDITSQKLIDNLLIFKKKGFKINFIKTVKLINQYISSKNKILICGNGGSASQASHFSTELVVRFKKEFERDAHNSICLGSDMTLLTAIGNDYGFDKIFSRQIEGIGNKKDLLILFSTSGKSKNLIEAVNSAKNIGLKTISITGRNGGKLKKITDFNINIDSNDTARIQECHLYIIHLIIELIETKKHKL
tara:strand:- start:3581 stop:4165 length:585 start_codon:yes stop_codon:yes gene_type:complete